MSKSVTVRIDTTVMKLLAMRTGFVAFYLSEGHLQTLMKVKLSLKAKATAYINSAV
jgi:hypothetical protein